MTINFNKTSISLFVLFAIVAASWVYQITKGSTKSEQSQIDEEIFTHSNITEDIDIWTGKIRVFERHKALRGIIVEGMLEDGDFKRFVQVAKLAGPEFSTVNLFSPGGNAVEAMKIGYLIRKLRYNTFVWPLEYEGERKCYFEDIKPQNCTCESACFLVFVAGVDRHPNMLGVHRVYLNHEALRSFQGSDAMTISKSVKGRVSQYLFEMGTPSSIVEKMFSVPSNEMAYLSSSELDQFKGEIDEIEEWVSAKCRNMNADEAINTLYENGFNMKLLDGEKDQSIIEFGQASCRNKVLENLTKDGWKSVFGSRI